MTIHPTALVSPKARIATDVRIGPYTLVHDNVVVESGSQIGPYCEIGVEVNDGRELGPLFVGRRATIRGHSTIYAGSTFGSDLRTGHRVTLREGLIVGPDCQVGTLGDFQGDSVIGRSFRSHSNVHIGKHSRIGEFVWIYPYVVLTNDPHPPSDVRLGVTVKDFAVIATMSTVMPGVTIGRGAVVGAQTLVRRDVEDGRVVVGIPGRDVAPVSAIRHRQLDIAAYPWRRHFHRGYSASDVSNWISEFDRDV